MHLGCWQASCQTCVAQFRATICKHAYLFLALPAQLIQPTHTSTTLPLTEQHHQPASPRKPEHAHWHILATHDFMAGCMQALQSISIAEERLVEQRADPRIPARTASALTSILSPLGYSPMTAAATHPLSMQVGGAHLGDNLVGTLGRMPQ